MSRTTLIVPGLHGSGEGHWQACWLQDDSDAVLVEQADWSSPDADRCLTTLERAVVAHPHALIVAHSLGAILAARMAHGPVASLIAGALLVAPADIERTGLLNGRTYEFGAMPMELLPFPSMLVASRNDPYMPFEKALGLGRAWGSRVHDAGRAGHVNTASGFGRWPEAYALADALTGVASGHISSRSRISQ